MELNMGMADFTRAFCPHLKDSLATSQSCLTHNKGTQALRMPQCASALGARRSTTSLILSPLSPSSQTFAHRYHDQP
eukprot:761608-Hanusia_phi.AAC.1